MKHRALGVTNEDEQMNGGTMKGSASLRVVLRVALSGPLSGVREETPPGFVPACSIAFRRLRR